MTASDGFDVLIGGSGKSTLNGSSAGDDLLIGGSISFGNVSFASNATQYIADLKSLSNIWGNGTSFASRMSSLNGTFTVTNSVFSDVLSGGSAAIDGIDNDWFWGNLGLDTIVNFQPGEIK